MPRKSNASRSPNGSGSIKEFTVTRRGKTYHYWKARYTAGYDPGTGKQIQRSIYGKTQKEANERMIKALSELNAGTYIAPNKQTVAEWLDIWVETYLHGVKPRTAEIYKSDIRLHIKPALGAIRLEALNAPTIQAFYNRLEKTPQNPKGLSPKTIKGVHGVLHKALKQAVLVGYIHFNPSDACVLPRREHTKVKPFDDDQIANFLNAASGSRFEMLYTLALFSGMREGEIFGLTWDCVDFRFGMISVEKQLQLHQEKGIRAYEFVPTKNDRCRTIAVAPSVMDALYHYKTSQKEHCLKFGLPWKEDGFVFANEIGEHLTKSTVIREFKRICQSIGRPTARFHDLRHSYAVASIRAGDDIKTVQGNLGHATASFTLDVYGHVTEQMKRASASRMEQYINSLAKPSAV